ncbi:hypothetical protein N7471_013693, partial [Penicillium samsonianum]|uniref:uncharacterized protein n=1 Tax=Penicillium samsonianum TaxID=1882272 RepID=UPI002548C702
MATLSIEVIMWVQKFEAEPVKERSVDEIITDQQRAAEAGVKNPPKVLFEKKNIKMVAHNPGTFEINSERTKERYAFW